MNAAALVLDSHPVLPCIVLPLVAGSLCVLIPRPLERARGWTAVAAAAVTLALVWRLFAGAASAPGGDSGPWLRVDALSAFVALAIAAFGLLVALYSVGYMRGRERQREYFAYLLWTVGAALGAVLANDLVVLLVGWGFVGLTLYLMTGIAGPAAADAARKSLMIVGGADAILVLGIVLVWSLSGSTRMDGGPIVLEGVAAHLAFLGFGAAAFAKAGAVPLHAWVPDCGEKADAPVAAFLPASLDKLLGVYLLARCALDLFAVTAPMGTVLMSLGAITVVGAAMMAMIQSDLKRLLAYSTVSQVGYMVLGIGTATTVGIAGGLFHMLNHAIYKCCLFLGAGAVQSRTDTTDLGALGGLGGHMPVTFVTFAIAALSISGIPPLNGFASKWMVYHGIISAGERGDPVWIVWLVAAMLGSALTLASFVKVLHAVFLRKPSPGIAARRVREVGLAMALPMVVLAAMCVVFGVFAWAVPLRWLVLPAVPAQAPGVWWSGLASALILVAIAVGAIVYVLTMRAGRLRRVETYIGGERIDEVYIRGETPGRDRHVEVTGVDFYRTFEELPGLHRAFELARRKTFDVYDLGQRCALFFVRLLRAAHGGVLPVYLTWFLGGVLAVVYVIVSRGP